MMERNTTPLDDLDRSSSTASLLEKNRDYWNQYYQRSKPVSEESSFAQFSYENFLKNKTGKIIEFGCGDGRDAFYFAKNGLNIFATDFSQSVIDQARKQNIYSNLVFHELDVSDSNALEKLPIADYYYSRFFIHAIPENAFKNFLNWLKKLQSDSTIIFEFRTDKDPLLEKSTKISVNEGVTDHYRRFINFCHFKQTLEEVGFQIVYDLESSDLSVYKEDNPVLGRIVANKKKIYIPHQFSKDLPLALYQLVYDFQTVMEKFNIPFFFSFGTLLGAARHGGLIPWDDDADCCILDEHTKEFEDNIVHLMQKMGYKTYDFGSCGGWTGYKAELWQDNKIITFLDIFYMKKKQDINKYIFPVGWGHMKLSSEQIYPLQKVKFGSFEINAPKDIDGFLTDNYGKQWKTHYQKYNHLFNCHEHNNVEMAQDDKLPAGPFGPLKNKRRKYIRSVTNVAI